MADARISELGAAGALDGSELVEVVKGGTNVQTTSQDMADLSGVTREFNRTFSEELLFDKNLIFVDTHEMDSDLVFTLASSGNVADQESVIRMTIISDGIHTITFQGTNFEFIYGMVNGGILPAGNHRVWLNYVNGGIEVNIPGTTQQTSGLTQLTAPPNFVVVADGENELDLSWDDVANESGYQIEKSATGLGGWVLFSNPVAGATSASEAGLNPGDTVFYRIKALGDGSVYADSPYSTASGTTEDAGDVTAPTFTFLPANGNAVWTVNKPLTITSNEPIRNADGSTIDNSNVAAVLVLKQTNSGGANIGFTATIDFTKTVITITPTTTYGTNQLVYLAIDDVEDVSGNEISLQSITFTTTAYTYFNGTTNRLNLGDILDTLFALADTNFWLEITLNNPNLSGTRRMIAKFGGPPHNQQVLYYNNNTIAYGYLGYVGGQIWRYVGWTGTDLAAGENVVVLKYDGAIDTNDGLDRATLLIDGATQGSKSDFGKTGSLPANLNSSGSAHLGVGATLDNHGIPIDANFYEGEAKNFIIRSNAGATVVVNIPVLALGTDTSGNAHHGTWV